MYYVPDGTKQCGYYECKKCGNRFLSLQTMTRIPCPECASEIDYEIGPDENACGRDRYGSASAENRGRGGSGENGCALKSCNYRRRL